jgi:GNAT superfamily N-acetyltransferase
MNTKAPLLIRQASDTDIETLVTYSAALARETEGKQLHTDTVRAGIRALLSSPSLGFMLVAEVENNQEGLVVGQLMVTYEWSDWRNSVFWWLQSVYVHPAWRRQGVYRAMHQHIIAQAKGNPSICGIRLYVERRNHTAKAAYQRVGLSPAKYIVYEEDFVFKADPLRTDMRSATEVP